MWFELATGRMFIETVSEAAMLTSSARNLRAHLGEFLGRVRYGQERVTVTSHGKPVAAIVSIDDLELLERIEDEMDLKTIEERRNEEAIPWDDAKRNLNRGNDGDSMGG